jgi:hypothetical protein
MDIPSGVLRRGSHGVLVKDLQKELGSAGWRPGSPDGVFGAATAAAVRSFQRSRHLPPDGLVGARTWAALGGDRFEAARAKQPDKVPAGSKRVTGYVHGKPVHVTVSPIGHGQYLRTDAAKGYLEMLAAARRAGIKGLSVATGFRTMAQQRYLYQGWIHHRRGFNKAAPPGYSNHQGGTAVDLNGVHSYHSAAYRWLKAHAARYGFKNDVGGEYWHFHYVGR